MSAPDMDFPLGLRSPKLPPTHRVIEAHELAFNVVLDGPIVETEMRWLVVTADMDMTTFGTMELVTIDRSQEKQILEFENTVFAPSRNWIMALYQSRVENMPTMKPNYQRRYG